MPKKPMLALACDGGAPRYATKAPRYATACATLCHRAPGALWITRPPRLLRARRYPDKKARTWRACLRRITERYATDGRDASHASPSF